VSVGIGGNDLATRRSRRTAAPTAVGPTKVGWSCESHYTRAVSTSWRQPLPRWAPKCRPSSPTSGSQRRQGVRDRLPTSCPRQARLLAALPFTSTDTAYLRHVEAGLNSALAAAAAEPATSTSTWRRRARRTAPAPRTTRAGRADRAVAGSYRCTRRDRHGSMAQVLEAPCASRRPSRAVHLPWRVLVGVPSRGALVTPCDSLSSTRRAVFERPRKEGGGTP